MRKTAVAIVIVLGLGTGGALGLFSLLDAIALRELPVPRPDELVAATPVDTTRSFASLGYPLSAYERVAATPGLFTSVAGVIGGGYLGGATGSDVRWWMDVDCVTAGYFDVLGIRPKIGRLLTAADVASAAPVAVASEQFWAHRLGGTPRAVGSTLTLQGVTLTIVGVLPGAFRGIEVGSPMDLTVPIGLFPALEHVTADYPSVGWLIARRAPGVTPAQIEAALQSRWPAIIRPAVPRSFSPDDAQIYFQSRIKAVPAATGVSLSAREDYERPLILLVVAAVLVVGLACINVSTLLLAQSAARERELAIRAALGASPARLVRLIFGQALRLSVIGAALGLVIAVWAARALASMFWPYWDGSPVDVSPDRNVMIAVAVTAFISALVAVLLPAVRATRSDLIQSVRSTAGASARTRRWGHRLLVVQISAATMLFIAGWVVTANLRHLMSRPGFAVDDVSIVDLDQRPGGYPEHFDIPAYDRRVAETVAAIPGVQAVGLFMGYPLGGADRYPRLQISSRTAAGHVEALDFPLAPGAFDAIQVPVVQGRDFTWADDSTHPRVVIVSMSVAGAVFGDTAAVGRQISVGGPAGSVDAEIVGVVSDARLLDLHQEHTPILYSPIAQEGGHAGTSPVVLVRASAPQSGWVSQVRSRIQAMGQDDVAQVDTMGSGIRGSVLQDRLIVIGAMYFAVLAALIMAVGLSGLLAYSVASRTREIGIRSAIGAPGTSIRRLIIREAMTTVAAGLALGLVLTLPLAKLLARSPIPIGAPGLAAFVWAAALTMTIGLAAAWVPARRATAITPLDALKAE